VDSTSRSLNLRCNVIAKSICGAIIKKNVSTFDDSQFFVTVSLKLRAHAFCFPLNLASSVYIKLVSMPTHPIHRTVEREWTTSKGPLGAAY
jgi:hypothetical protein